MILIIAVALGLAINRGNIAVVIETIRLAPPRAFLTLAGAVSLGRFLNIILLIFLVHLLPAFLVLRLRRPRPPLRSLIHQPGFAACASPMIVLLASLPLNLLDPPESLTEPVAIGVEILLGSVAPLAWVCLIATRRWAPEPGWIDRLGRVLGVLYMACAPAHSILIRLPI